MNEETINQFVNAGGIIKTEFPKFTLEEYKKLGFRKMNEEEKALASMAFANIPKEILHHLYDTEVHKSFNKAVKGSLIAVLKPGTYMPMSKTTPGALSNVGLSIETNKAGVGNPVFFKNDAILNSPNGPIIATGIINTISFMVGQYHIAQISGTLSIIENDIEEILNFLEDEHRAKLETTMQIYYRVCNEIKYAIGNERRMSELRSYIFLAVLPTSLDLINFSTKQIEDLINKLNTEDDKETIRIKTHRLYEYIMQYKTAMLLYEKSLQLLLFLSQTSDPKEIEELYLTPLEETINQYKENGMRWENNITDFLNNSNTYKNKSTFSTIIEVLFSQAKPKALVLSEKPSKQINLHTVLTEIMKYDLIEAPYHSIQISQRAITEGITLLKYNDEFYTNYPA